MTKIEIDLLVVTALPEELTAVFNLKEGGRESWQSAQTNEKHTYYTTSFLLKDKKQFSVCAIAQSDMGGLTTSTAVSNILSFVKPKMACMVGICAGWRQKSIELGDIIAASHAFIYDLGKIKDGKLFIEMKDFVVHSYLKQWLQDFCLHNDSWKKDVKTNKPLSLRYQQEYILFNLKNNQTDDWIFTEETTKNCPNYENAIKELEKKGLITANATIALTEKANQLLSELRLKKRQNAPTPDRTDPQAHYGSFASGNNVVEDSGIFDSLAEKDRKVLALEMEAAAFLQACYTKDTSMAAFIVKGACDYADGEKNDLFHKYAAETAARFMFHFVCEALFKIKMENPH